MPVITVWPSLANTEGRVVERESWAPHFDDLDANGQRPFRGDMAQPGWSAARFNPPVRVDANVVAMTAIVLDYDGDGGETLEDAERMWRVFYGLVHTTRRHEPEAHRFRVVLPLVHEIAPDNYKRLWTFVVRMSGHRVDPKTRNPSRFWYVPGSANGGGYRSIRLGGMMLDPDPMLIEAAADEEAQRKPPVTRIHSAAESRADRYAQRALDDACNAAGMASEGTRNNALFLAACTAGNFLATGNLTQSYAYERLETSAQMCGLPLFEARKTILSGIAKGMQSPRQIPEPSVEPRAHAHAQEAATGTYQRTAGAHGGGPESRPQSSASGSDEEKAAEAAEPPKRPVYQTLSEFIRSSLKPVGQRLETGFVTLDQATRGGVPLGRVVVLAGAPGAAKTTLAAFLCDCWERSGCAVVYLAADEPAEGIAIRLGQLAGFSRDGLETEGDVGDAVRAGFAARAEGRPLVVLDPDAEDAPSTIEAAEEVVLDLAGDRPRVLVIDSLQTVRCDAAEMAESAKERIDIKLRVIKSIAKRGTLVIAISEMARSGYRANNRADNVSALAAGKESGAIEYGASLLLGLRSVKGEVGQVDVEVAKNRLGGHKPELRMKLDFDRASFAEIATPGADGSDEEVDDSTTAVKRMERAKHRIRECLRTHTDLTSVREVLAHCAGTKDHNYDALKDMQKRGEVVRVGNAFHLQVGAS
jgi:KaiC/GvpD/RAD55 family RecA-like ATPase